MPRAPHAVSEPGSILSYINFNIMLRCIVFLLAALLSCNPSIATVTPMITWVEDGYNFIAKLPCVSCPFLYQDTSKGEDQQWSERNAANSLVRRNLHECSFPKPFHSQNYLQMSSPNKRTLFIIQIRLYMVLTQPPASKHQSPLHQSNPLHQPGRPPTTPCLHQIAPNLRPTSLSRLLQYRTLHPRLFKPTRHCRQRLLRPLLRLLHPPDPRQASSPVPIRRPGCRI